MGNGMNKVLPGLYVGNFRDSKDPEQLKAHHITHILSIHDNARKLPCNSDKEYLCILASDSPGQNLTQYFPACNDFIHTARLKGGSVLIHCLAGMSRSVTVAVVYVMCVTSLSWRDSLKAVRGARNVANPNVGFLKQLQDFETDRMNDERRRLKAKYPSMKLEEEDEQMAKQLLASYYHSLSVGEMCEGNCPVGVTCPRGLCHPTRRVGLFRRNSASRSSSPSRRSCSPSRSPYSPSSSPVSPRRSSPTPPSPLTRRSSRSSSPQLTPPQQSSPQLTPQHASPRTVTRRISSPMTSPRHASVPQTSPSHSLSSASSHRGSSPTSPHRSRSPSRSLDSSPMSSPLYGSSSSINSPKHTLHTYTSPPSSPSRSVSPSGSQKRKASPVPSPKHLSSTPNSPQHTVTKTSPKSFFRQCTLWVQSARKSSENNSSKENAAQKETVDSNSNPKQSKTTEMKPEVLVNGSVKQVSPLHTQDVSLSDPISTDISLPQQYSDYSPYTQPAIMKSYVHIYRQSSLPEEESEESLRLSVSPFSSPQHQRYKWITRHTVPPPTIPCPYNELFKQASLQESRYKPNKTPYQQTSISVPVLNKNIHTSSSQGNSEEYRKRECTRVSSLNSTYSVSDMPEKHVPRQSSLPERSTLTVTGQYQPQCVTRHDIQNSPNSSVTQKITESPETIHEQIHITLCNEPDALESPQRNVSSCRYEVPILSALEDDLSKPSSQHGCSLKNDDKLDSQSLKEGKDSHALPQASKSRNEPPRKEKSHISDHSGKGNKSCNLTRPDSSPDIPSVQSNKICSPSPQGKKHNQSPSPDKKPGTPPLQERRSTTTNKRDSKPGTPPLQDGKSTLPRSRDRKSSSSSMRDSKPGTPPLQERKCTSLQDSKPVTPPLRDRKSSTSSSRDRKASITSLHEGKPVTPPLRERKSSSSSLREGKAATPSSQDKKSSSSLRDKPSTPSQQEKKPISKDKKSQDKKPGTPPLKTRKSSSSMVEDKKGNTSAECKNTGYTSKEDKKSDSTHTKDKMLPNKALSTTTTRHKKPSSSHSQENVSETPSTKDKTADTSIKHSKKANTSQTDSKKAAGPNSQSSHTTTPVTSPVHGRKSTATSHDKKSSTHQSKNEEASPSIYGKEAGKTEPKASHSTQKTSTLTRQKSKSSTLIDQEGRPATLPRKDTKSVHTQQNSGNQKCKTSMQDAKVISSPKDKNSTVNLTKQENRAKTTKRQDSRSNVHKIPSSKSCTFKRQDSKPDSSKGESSKPCTIARQNSKSGNLSSSDSKPDILSKENDEYIMPASNNKAHKSQPPQAYCSKMEELTKASNPDHSCAISCLLPRTSSQNSLHNLSTCQHTGLGLNDAHSHEPFITPVHQQSQLSKTSAQNKHPSASEHELEPLLPAQQQPQLSTQQNALPSLTEPNPMSAPIQEQPKSVHSPVPIPNSGPLKLQAQVLLIQSQPSCSPCLSSLSSGGPSRQPVTKTYLVDKPMSHHHHHPKLLFSSPIGDALSPCTPNS
ncbi:serine/arginine repetitive matrix protein 2-like isoform X2 [Penaeus indicus]|uniref:serine/arginine repetitive matrix protein 2-like isoform X2 n=1 Tax=Penaeus indicus TaxID=29960 RepID=UPI00300C1F4D